MRRAAIIAGFAVVGFAITLAGYMAARLGEEEVALLAGMLCGASAAMPLGIAAGVALAGRRRRSGDAPPSVIVMTPPVAMPGGIARPAAPTPPIRAGSPAVNIIGRSDLGDE